MLLVVGGTMLLVVGETMLWRLIVVQVQSSATICQQLSLELRQKDDAIAALQGQLAEVTPHPGLS